MKRWRMALLVGAGWLALAAPLVACFDPTFDSVRFNAERVEFFSMPQPWRGVPLEKRALPRVSTLRGDGWTQAEAAEARLQRLAKTAAEAERRADFRAATAGWERYTRAYEEEHSASRFWWPDPGPPARKGLEDRIAALRAWRGPADTGSLRQYLRARDLIDAGKLDEAARVSARLRGSSYDRRARYLGASVRLYLGQPEAALREYRSLLAAAPKDAPAAYMVGRCLLRLANGGVDPDLEEGAAARSVDLRPDTLARLRDAAAAYERCAEIAPEGPLAVDAVGMAGHCYYRLNDYPLALAAYCRQLAGLPPGKSRLDAWLSARMCLDRMSLTDHRTFQTLVRDRADLASAYIDLHVHYGRGGVKAQHELGLFALNVLKRAPSAPLSGRLLTRLALIEERAGRHERALRLARAAAARCPAGFHRDQARWQEAEALHRLGRDAEALAAYERLSESAETEKLRMGAHEAAAILAERLGDLPNAIRHYFGVDYRVDYAYAIDVLASQEDLRAFLRRWPRHPQADLVRYSLGFRQLRAHQYEDAVTTFRSLGATISALEKRYERTTSKGKPLPSALEAASFLAESGRREQAAATPAERARVAYEIGRFYYHGRHELLYNGALWEGNRVFTFLYNWPPANLKDPSRKEIGTEEREAAKRHHEEHTALFQALKVFERVARDYPDTAEAPKAHYSAALCYTLLSSMQTYWEGNRDINYLGRAIEHYHALQRRYPDHPLAADALRWAGPLPVKK